MKRRNFLQASAVAATALAGAKLQAAETRGSQRDYYEWRTWQLSDEQQVPLLKYLERALVPGWKRQGLGTVGVFTETGESAGASVHVLVTCRSLDQLAGARDALAEDREFLNAGQEYLMRPADAPAFDRIESSLMVAFAGMLRVEIPKFESPVFEMRVYESYSEAKARRKIAMFNNGEIDVFRDLGFQPTFFGETLIGSRLPNLRYMLAAESIEALDAGWEAFHEHPDWVAMRDLPEYADTVSHITKARLKSTAFSDI